MIRLRYVHRYRDRLGRERLYLRRGGHRIALPGPVGSAEFLTAYQAALALTAPPEAAAGPPPAGTFSAIVAAWYRSADFRALGPTTQRIYRRIAESLRRLIGEHPARLIEPRHVRKIVADKAETPAAANHTLRILRRILRQAVRDESLSVDPTRDVEAVPRRERGYPTWSEAEIAAYEARWPIGTRERLAFDLLLYTGQRRSDVIRMGRQHVRGGVLYVQQAKTGAELEIPLHPRLAASIEVAAPVEHLTYLVTAWGAGFASGNAFYNWFRSTCDRAGIPPGRSPHGLRKAAARRLAEAGCTAHEIMSITGHRTLAEVQRYTRAADQARLARGAVLRLGTPGERGSG